VSCPFCDQKVYSASFQVGKVKCSFCGRKARKNEAKRLALEKRADIYQAIARKR